MGRKAARSAGEKLVFIEGLRGLAALYVVIGHICSMADPGVFMGLRGPGPEWLRIGMQPFGYGHLAVAAFIVMSGFCLQTSLFNGGAGELTDIKRFFKRRALRILPPYYACLGISLLVALYITPLGQGLPFSQYIPVTKDVLLSHVLMYHNFSPDWMYKINGVLWSIAIESQLYFIFPLLVWVMAKAGRPSMLVLAASASSAVLIAWPQLEKLYPWYLGLFALGMAGSHLAYKPPVWRGPNAFSALLLGSAALVGCIWAVVHKLSLPICDAWMGVVLICVLYAGAISKKLWLSKALACKPLAGLGAISYSLYLMHHPIMQPLYLFRPQWATDPLMATVYLVVVGLPAILLACTVFWFIFERPFVSKRATRPQREYAPKKLRPAAVVYAPAKREAAEPVGR
jgi:peptidoglycan/LPS O-acetylase OafA/YrhL